jgi:3-oxoacyl-[acyl-carrier protein] reductase
MEIKYALVTGGSRGIGKAISLQLAADGYHVLINYKSNITEAQNTLHSIKENGGSAEIMEFDVANQESVEKALGNWMKNQQTEPCIEVLVNNAGLRKDGLFMWMTNEDWDAVVDPNIKGFLYVTRFLIQKMLVKRYGRIINVVSLSGLKGTPGQTNYSAAKAAVIGATKALAQEVGKRGVTVNAVAPGFIKTDMTIDLDEKDYKQLIPMSRFGTAEEVANLVGFLASSKASYITGEVININGGLYS